MKKREVLRNRCYDPVGNNKYRGWSHQIGDLYVGTEIDLETNEIYLYCNGRIKSQKDIDNLQITFNNLKWEVREIQTYED